MTSAVDIQIVNPPNLEKIENFLKDPTYRETIEFSANFNTRLCLERRLRLPFLDPQTGVAQNHSNLFMDKRQRMPGFRQGQIYSYPATRWRKSRRQYLSKMYRYTERPFQSLRREPGIETVDSDFNGTLLEESSSLGGADTSDSKDSQQHLKDELPKEWLYDEVDINEFDALEEPKSPADDEYDYDPRYGSKKRKKRRPGKKSQTLPHIPETTRKGRPSGTGLGTGRGRGRRKTTRGGATSGGGSSDSRLIDPPSPGMIIEPPSFETAAAAVENSVPATPDEHASGSGTGDLRNYRKYL